VATVRVLFGEVRDSSNSEVISVCRKKLQELAESSDIDGVGTPFALIDGVDEKKFEGVCQYRQVFDTQGLGVPETSDGFCGGNRRDLEMAPPWF
jgi:hypothetical protein